MVSRSASWDRLLPVQQNGLPSSCLLEWGSNKLNLGLGWDQTLAKTEEVTVGPSIESVDLGVSQGTLYTAGGENMTEPKRQVSSEPWGRWRGKARESRKSRHLLEVVRMALWHDKLAYEHSAHQAGSGSMRDPRLWTCHCHPQSSTYWLHPCTHNVKFSPSATRQLSIYL